MIRLVQASSVSHHSFLLAVQLTAQNVAVLLLHHPRKGVLREGQAAGGSGALSGYVDVLIEMRTLAGAGPDDRRRQLSAWSRHDETPHELVIELADDGSDYRDCPEVAEEALDHGLARLREVLRRAKQKLTREELLAAWPERSKPGKTSLWRWIDMGVERGQLTRHGTGRRSDPYRYSLPERQPDWYPTFGEVLSRFGLR